MSPIPFGGWRIVLIKASKENPEWYWNGTCREEVAKDPQN